MTENDDKLVEMFFADNSEELADNGFSERVMSNLPTRRSYLLERIWTVFCTIVGIALFFLIDGVKLLKIGFNNIFGDLSGSFYSINFNHLTPAMVVIAFFVILSISAYNIATAKE